MDRDDKVEQDERLRDAEDNFYASIEVPPTPTTDEEFAKLPVLRLSDFDF